MAAKETHATIERVRRISARFQRLELGVDESLARLKPGQAVLARLSDETWDPYLPELWTPVAVDGGTVTVERPASTLYVPGQAVTLLGPVGAPFPMRPVLRNLLLIALDTPPTPLVFLATMAIRSKIAVTMVLGGAAVEYPLDVLPPEVEVLEGDLERGWPNQVTTVGWADQVIAAANPAYREAVYLRLMKRVRELRADVPARYLLGIFDVPMLCGVGACQGCRVSCKGEDRLTCQDGPAIDLDQVVF
jgi:NAD(P)H-flavin reductase